MTSTDEPLVAGLDPSLTATGIADSTGRLQLFGQGGITNLPIIKQRDALEDHARRIFDDIYQAPGRPALLVIETPETSHRYGGLSERIGLFWLLLGQFRGYIPVAVATPAARMMYATGKGSATKGAIIDAVARRLPQFETRGNDNLADAAILCAMGRDWLGAPLCEMPKTHRAALDRVQWPK